MIRKIAEENLLSTLADSEEEHKIRIQEAADISNVELLTTSLSRGTPCRTNTHMQLIHDFDRAEIEICLTYRHAFDIHRCMGGQRVHSRPLFTSRRIKHIKDGITTTSRCQLSAKNRLEIFEHTGVTTEEYDITLPWVGFAEKHYQSNTVLIGQAPPRYTNVKNK